MKRAFVVVLLAGCFPYRELYRPDLQGRVLDEGGAAVPGVEVHSCSYSRWSRPAAECPRAASRVTDADGGFAFGALKEWEWCCLGEAPMPITELYVCAGDAGTGYVSDAHGWPKSELVLRLGEGSPRCAQQ